MGRWKGKIRVALGPMDVEVSYSAYSDPGNTSGSVDKCYPADQEMNIEEVIMEEVDIMHLLSDEALDKIEVACWGDVQAIIDRTDSFDYRDDDDWGVAPC